MARNRWIVQVAKGKRSYVTVAEERTFFRGWCAYVAAYDLVGGTKKRLVHVRGKRARTILRDVT